MTKKIAHKIQASDIASRLVKGISWSMISSIIGKGVVLIAFVLVARILGKEEYGRLGMIRSTVTMFMTFSSMGMGLTASRYIAYYRSQDKERTYKIYKASNVIVFFFGLIISLLVFIFSEHISKISFNTYDLAIPLKIATIIIFFTSLSSAQNGVLNGFEDFKSIGINTSIQGVIQAVLVIIGAYSYGLNGVIVGLSISAICLCLLHWNSLKKRILDYKPIYKIKIFDSETRNIWMRFSIPAVLAGFITVPVFWWVKTYLVRNSGFGEVAIFDIAEQWNMLLLFIPSSIGSIILPLLSNTLADGTKNQYNKLIKLNLLINGGITLFMSLIIVPFAPYILKLYGNSFVDYLPLCIMLGVAILQAGNTVLGQVIASKDRMWLGLFVNLLWAVWLILFSYIFIGKLSLGALGLSYAMLISYVLHSIIQVFIAFRFKL